MSAATLCLDRGADVELTEQTGATPLYVACGHGRTEAAQLCLDRGANVATALPDGRTALYIACARDHVDVAKLLLDRGAKVDQAAQGLGGITPLYVACQVGNLGAAKLCLDRGAEVDRASRDGTPLYIACAKGHIDAATLCLDYKAAINWAHAQHGWSPLIIACWNGHCDTVRLLLRRGADIEQGATTGVSINREIYRISNSHDAARLSVKCHPALTAWLRRIRALGGWTKYVSEPRYKLVVLRELSARNRARREREFFGKELVLDFLFPPRANKKHLPNYPFSLVARYYWGGATPAEEDDDATVPIEDDDIHDDATA